jgi:hypothetical protein
MMKERCMRKRPAYGLLAQKLAKASAVESIERSCIVEVVGHGERRALKIAGILPHIGLGNRQ